MGEMFMKVEQQADGGVVIRLEKRESMLLRVALERASFVDTQPQHQAATLELTEKLLAALEI